MHVSLSIVVTHDNGAGVSKGQMFSNPTPEEIARAIRLILNVLPQKTQFETLEHLKLSE